MQSYLELSPARIVRIGLNVADLGRSTEFYIDGLGFELGLTGRLEGPKFEALIGIAGAAASFARLRLGREKIELRAYDSPGPCYPEPRFANDPWFQHFAIAVSDMDQAYKIICNQPHAPISIGGPQQLPPSTGSVIAYKFRDPDGHPLELSYIPSGMSADRDNSSPQGAVFLGVDHSAITVSELETSIAFYTQTVGFGVAARVLNRGPTQERLDGLVGAEVDIVSLKSAAGGPHLELLHYRAPAMLLSSRFLARNAIAATRLIIEGAPTGRPASKLSSAWSHNNEPCDPARNCLIPDPDGHLLELRCSPTQSVQ